MERNARTLLLELIRHQYIIASWGLSNIRIASNELCFDVNGFRYKGGISIKASGNQYSVCLGNHVWHNIALSQMVSLLDEQIEAGGDYVANIVRWLDDI